MSEPYISGLERSRLLWMIDVAPALESGVPDLYPYLAAGLVGDGSDCFGYDDQISADHDCATRVKIWIPIGVGGEGAAWRIRAAIDRGEVIVEEIPAFYRRFTGLDYTPRTWQQWLAIAPKNLAAATNGAVFFDAPGKFSQRRAELNAFYPFDVQLKLLEGGVLRMGQAGQYNYPRCLARGERVAAELAKSIFMKAALSVIFILNSRYMPFYKWAHRAARDLPVLGKAGAEALERIATAPNATEEIENLCMAILHELQARSLTSSSSTFFVDHAPVLRGQIIDPELREENPWKR